MTQVNIGKGLEINVDFSAFNQSVLDHILYIGARNILMDCHAGVTRESVGVDGDVAAQSLAVAEKKLAAMLAGEVRTTATRTGDPVKQEAIRIAADRIKAKVRAFGKKVTDIDPKALRDAAVALVEKTPAIMDQARANIDAAKALDVDVDISTL